MTDAPRPDAVARPPASTPAPPVVTFAGLDHAALARRTRRWGWLQYAGYRQAAEKPFFWTAFVTALGNPVLYLVAMGLGLGSIVQADVEGVRYLWFVAPGLLVATVVSTGAQFGTWPIFGGFKWQKHYYAAHSTPVEPWQMPIGEGVAISVRLFVQALLFWVVGLAFGAWPGAASVLVVPIAMLASMAMFAPLMAYAATLEEEGLQFNFVQRLVVMPMFLFAGTFFPLASMPVYLQWIGWVSPMWHGTQLARVVSYGASVPAWLIVVHVVFLVACVVGGLLAAARTFTRRLVR